MKKASWYDFVEISLYSNPPYTLRDMDYYIFSELKNEYQKHHTNEHLTMDYLRKFFDNRLIYVDEGH